ncbi:MAG: restriction endonuclease subunit S [Chlorobium sp.]|jgi:type I restriction enzyme S subunit|nr:restriction endonuclease subunit S [Chlorobium sp.]
MNENVRSRALLEKHFDIAFAAPDGIKKLRELILTIAMQGKLVPQDPNDQPASELLKEIEAEKRRMVKEGKIKPQKLLPEIKPDEVPYELPKSWAWVRLGQVSDYNGRKNSTSGEIADDTWLLDLEDIEKDTSRIIYRAKYSERLSTSTKSTFQKGDVLYGKLRPYLNKVVVADADGVCTTEIIPIVPSSAIDSQFLRWLLKRPTFLTHVDSLMYGVKMPRLGTDDAVKSIHPLPPFAEQQRIVARIDQLMSRCDELEKLRAEREAKRLTVHISALNRLFEAQGSDSFTDAWHFINRHFSELYSVKANVTELRKAILQLGVMGKLVPQDPNDQPARELLKEIEAEKRRLVKEGKIKPQKPLPEIKSEDVPYALPKIWRWVRLDDICYGITSGSTPPQNIFNSEGGVPYLKVYNIRKQNIDFHYKPQFISRDYHNQKLKRSILHPGDVVMNIVGPPLGKVAIIPDEYPEYNCNQAIVIYKPLIKRLNAYIYHYLSAGSFLEKIDLIGTAGQDNISITKSRMVPIPLPPLAEQHRIVAKIDKLMALCDQLEQQIDATASKKSALLNSAMRLI